MSFSSVLTLGVGAEIPSKAFSLGWDGILSTKTGVTFSLLVLLFTGLFGRVMCKDKTISNIPESTIKPVFQELGIPRNGIIKINIPRKNVLFRFIIRILYTEQ